MTESKLTRTCERMVQNSVWNIGGGYCHVWIQPLEGETCCHPCAVWCWRRNIQKKQPNAANHLGVERKIKTFTWWKLLVLSFVPGICCSSSCLASLVLFNISIGSIWTLEPPCEGILLESKSSKGARKKICIFKLGLLRLLGASRLD